MVTLLCLALGHCDYSESSDVFHMFHLLCVQYANFPNVFKQNNIWMKAFQYIITNWHLFILMVDAC